MENGDSYKIVDDPSTFNFTSTEETPLIVTLQKLPPYEYPSYVGVRVMKRNARHPRFTCEISHNRKRVYLGSFPYNVHAAKAYDDYYQQHMQSSGIQRTLNFATYDDYLTALLDEKQNSNNPENSEQPPTKTSAPIRKITTTKNKKSGIEQSLMNEIQLLIQQGIKDRKRKRTTNTVQSPKKHRSARRTKLTPLKIKSSPSRSSTSKLKTPVKRNLMVTSPTKRETPVKRSRITTTPTKRKTPSRRTPKQIPVVKKFRTVTPKAKKTTALIVKRPRPSYSKHERNGYHIFSRGYALRLKQSGVVISRKRGAIGSMVGKAWRDLTEEERDYYEMEASKLNHYKTDSSDNEDEDEDDEVEEDGDDELEEEIEDDDEEEEDIEEGATEEEGEDVDEIISDNEERIENGKKFSRNKTKIEGIFDDADEDQPIFTRATSKKTIIHDDTTNTNDQEQKQGNINGSSENTIIPSFTASTISNASISVSTMQSENQKQKDSYNNDTTIIYSPTTTSQTTITSIQEHQKEVDCIHDSQIAVPRTGYRKATFLKQNKKKDYNAISPSTSINVHQKQDKKQKEEQKEDFNNGNTNVIFSSTKATASTVIKEDANKQQQQHYKNRSDTKISTFHEDRNQQQSTTTFEHGNVAMTSRNLPKANAEYGSFSLATSSSLPTTATITKDHYHHLDDNKNMTSSSSHELLSSFSTLSLFLVHEDDNGNDDQRSILFLHVGLFICSLVVYVFL